MSDPESKYSLPGWDSLYEHSKDGIRNKYDVVALLFHHFLIKQGFQYTGPNSSASTSSEPPKENDGTMKMPEGWNTGENYNWLYARQGHNYVVESCKSEHCIIFNISTNTETGRKVQAILFELNDVVQTEGTVEDMIPSYKRMIDNMETKVSDVLQNEVVNQEVHEEPDCGCFAYQLPVPADAPDAVPDAVQGVVPEALPDAVPDEAPDAVQDEVPGGFIPDAVPRVAGRGFLGRVPRANPRGVLGGAAGIRNDNMLANLLFGNLDDDFQFDYHRQRAMPRGGLPLRVLRDRRNPYLPGGRRIGEADLNPLAGQPPNGGMLLDPFQPGPHDYPRMRFDPFGPPGTNDPFGHHTDHDNLS